MEEILTAAQRLADNPLFDDWLRAVKEYPSGTQYRAGLRLMAVFLLDTTTLTLLQHRHPITAANLLAHDGDTIAVASVNIEEALGGWYAALRQARTNAEQARAASLMADAFMFLAQFPVTRAPRPPSIGPTG